MNTRASLLSLFAALAACATAPQGKRVEAAAAHDPRPLVEALVQKHGEASRTRAERGVKQVIALWRDDDGDGKALQKPISPGTTYGCTISSPPEASGRSSAICACSAIGTCATRSRLNMPRARPGWSGSG